MNCSASNTAGAEGLAVHHIEEIAYFRAGGRCVIWLGVIILTIGSGIGGCLVYRGGAGVEPEMLIPAVREHEH